MTTTLEVPCQADPESFFPKHVGDDQKARDACAPCPLRKECAAAAIAVTVDHDLFGVWAGVWAGRDAGWRNKLLQIAGMTKAPDKSRGQEPRPTRDLPTHCVHGHEWTTENTRWGRHGRRTCRACAKNQAIKYAPPSHCPKGHAMEGDNVRLSVSGKRLCATCTTKTHCPEGHEYTAANKMVCKRGLVTCRTCKNRRQNARRKKDRKAKRESK